MKDVMRRGAAALKKLLAADPVTAGTVVRIHGEHLILARECEEMDDGEATIEDRVRLTRLAGGAWGLGVKRHHGRWERTPFTGDIAELVDVIRTFMQHLVGS
jgi:hypothetical protein